MRQRRHHFSQSGKSFVPAQFTLQATGFRLVREQNDLAIHTQITGGNADTTTIAQGNLVTIVLTRRKTALDHLAPDLAFQRLTQKVERRGIGLGYTASGIQYHHATWQKIDQAFKA